jgi:cell division septation protein DedD
MQVPDRFTAEKVKCPICKKPMEHAQAKPKVWWEDHQESIKKIMGIPETDAGTAGGAKYRDEKIEQELENLDVEVAQGEGAHEGMMEDNGDDTPSEFRGKRPWSGWSKALLFGLIGLLIGLLLVLFVVRPRTQKTERPGGIVEPPERISGPEGPSVYEAHQEPEPVSLQSGRGPLTSPVSEHPESEEIPGPVSAADKAAGGEEKTTVLSRLGGLEEPKPVETGPESAAMLNREAEIEGESPRVKATFTVCVGSFREKARADRYVEELKNRGFDALEREVDLGQKGRWFRVSIGEFSSPGEAEFFAKNLREKGFKTFVAKHSEDQKTPVFREPNPESPSKPANQKSLPPGTPYIHLFRS